MTTNNKHIRTRAFALVFILGNRDMRAILYTLLIFCKKTKIIVPIL